MHRTHTLLFLLLPAACVSRDIERILAEAPPCTTTGTDETTAAAADTSSSDETSNGAGTGSSGDPTTDASATVSTSTSGSTDATTTGETTATPPPVCGDGVVEDDEECDDGNQAPEDGCSDACTTDIRAFVSSVTYRAGDLKSLYLADALCFNRAADAGLPEPLQFKAFLSDSQTDARDRFSGRGRIVMVNGLVLADSWAALLAGELEQPLEVTEKSETYHGKVWTGTQPDGTRVPGSSHCADWSSYSAVDYAYYGYSDEISEEWLLADQLDNPAECPVQFALYCFDSF